MRKLAVAMIVKNESSCLDKCLESIREFPDIYILDTGSEDNTCEIARKWTQNVYENEFKWNDSFCDARNYINSKIDAEWIMSIDADNALELGGYAKVLKAIDDAEKKGMHTVSVILEHDKSGEKHYFPNIYRSTCKWVGNIHNHLNVAEQNYSDIKIVYGYSNAHKKDPDRALRILSKEVLIPGKVREKYYLAREYYYRRNWVTAIDWYNAYLQEAKWSPEIADAYIMLARCHAARSEWGEARINCLQAIEVNNDFKEALEFMADLTGPKNSERWLNYAYQAQNEDVLFIRDKKERKQEFYNYIASDDLKRYVNIYKRVGELCKGKRVIDCGCGTAELSKYIEPIDPGYDSAILNEHIPKYYGIDFCKEAIAKAVTKDVAVMNLYTDPFFGYCVNGRDVIIFLEVLEHLERDREVISNIPSGREIILSVPSFGGNGHLRRYTNRVTQARYGSLIKFNLIERYNMLNGVWTKDAPITAHHITLMRGIKK